MIWAPPQFELCRWMIFVGDKDVLAAIWNEDHPFRGRNKHHSSQNRVYPINLNQKSELGMVYYWVYHVCCFIDLSIVLLRYFSDSDRHRQRLSLFHSTTSWRWAYLRQGIMFNSDCFKTSVAHVFVALRHPGCSNQWPQDGKGWLPVHWRTHELAARLTPPILWRLGRHRPKWPVFDRKMLINHWVWE
jgi:hypothetical protein